MVNDAETSDNQVRVGHGAPEEGDGMWLRNIVDSPAAPWSSSENASSIEWMT